MGSAFHLALPDQQERAAPIAGATPLAKRRSRRRVFFITALVLLVVACAVRLAMPGAIRWYVLRALQRSPVYDGLLDEIDVHLWRGAYSIENLRIIKTTGNVPVPFFAARRVDLAIEGRALLSGSLVGRITLESPEINFVDAAERSQSQTGAEGPWLEIIRDLFPFRINSAQIKDGAIHFRAFHTAPPVDLHLTSLEAEIENLTNIHDDVAPLISTVRARALAMEHARVDYEMRLDPFSYRPTFEMAVRVIGLDVTKTNSLAQAYGRFDFESGWFDLVVELVAREGLVTGYVKPLFRHLTIFDFRNDVRGANLLSVFWQALVGAGAQIVTNPGRDQIATVIPVSGSMDSPRSNTLAALGNLLHNAFVRAYMPTLHGKGAQDTGITFGPAESLTGAEPREHKGTPR